MIIVDFLEATINHRIRSAEHIRKPADISMKSIHSPEIQSFKASLKTPVVKLEIPNSIPSLPIPLSTVQYGETIDS